MADKKITALTALNATGKDSAADFLHIIDYSASPVNKKITVADLFSNVNTDTHIYGNSKVFEIGQAAAVNSHIRVAVGANATTDGAVTINDDGVAYVDFIVKSLTSDQAIKVDAGADTVTINGDSTVLDFVVKGDTTTLIHADGGEDAVGIGTATIATNTTLTVAADATSGHAASLAGNLLLTGSETLTPAVNAAQAIGLTTPVSRYTTAASGTNDLTIADGTAGQIKHIVTVNTGGGNGVLNSTNVAGAEVITLQHEGDSVILWYDGTTTLWYPLGTHAAGAGS